MPPTWEQIDRWADLSDTALADVLRRLPDGQVADMTWLIDVIARTKAVKKRRNKPGTVPPQPSGYL